MNKKEVHIGDDWYLDENDDGDLIVVNSNTGKVVKAIDKETGNEDKKGNSVNNVFTKETEPHTYKQFFTGDIYEGTTLSPGDRFGGFNIYTSNSTINVTSTDQANVILSIPLPHPIYYLSGTVPIISLSAKMQNTSGLNTGYLEAYCFSNTQQTDTRATHRERVYPHQLSSEKFVRSESYLVMARTTAELGNGTWGTSYDGGYDSKSYPAINIRAAVADANGSLDINYLNVSIMYEVL